ncbi:glycosyltransferase [Rhodoblastus sp. 17X3]|uniref:glycosyltransferase n=1 Tax=Rhodoblastus sp. 17X3 TaxID=3047026 RepID=UPI0024B71AF5|nr:glycosyltransferase [Rhodoblastus sp. 17X3]MDI9848822.1 glycosyltransferase [Rhodoblastus sp. 17X3]
MKQLESSIFLDLDFYKVESGKSFKTREDARDHFIKTGQTLGLNPSPYFMWSWVREQFENATVEQYFSRKLTVPPHPLLKLRRVKAFVRRRNWPVALSDWIAASELSELVPGAFLQEEHRSMSPHRFFSAVTSSKNQNPLESDFFSSRWYNIAYKDVSSDKKNPLIHYLVSGWKEARDPSPQFCTRTYLEHFDDVSESGSNPLLHYANFGHEEGRYVALTKNYELAVRYQSLSDTGPKAYVGFDGPADFPLDHLSFGEKKNLVIVIPFYKREDLVETVLSSLIACTGELRKIGAVVVLINDSPDYAMLDKAICSWFSKLDAQSIDTLYLCNSRNRGFVYSSNCGIWVAEKLGAHCLLLNSDTVVYPGAIAELLSVLESDEKFGFVNPRTNNATIATYGAKPATPVDGYSSFSRTHQLLPRYQVVPVVVGFCLLIRAEIVRYFGYLDSIYGMGYNEENDYIMRANRRGYSSVLANHAYVAHLGKASFSILSDYADDEHLKNEAVLLTRYPEFKPAIIRHFSSPKYHAHRLIERGNDVDVLFDIRTASKTRNGTNKLICALLPFLLRELSDVRLAIVADDDVLDFFGVHLPSGVRLITDEEEAANVKAGVGFLFSQPFADIVFDRLACVCEKIGVFLLDTIAVDCLYIQSDGLVRLWERVCRSGDLFVFNSEYTMDRFTKRFSFAPDAALLPSLHSMNPMEYAQDKRESPRRRKAASARASVLIFGNHYEHKGLVPALSTLAATDLDITVFGVDLGRNDVKSISGGQVSDETLARMLASCDVFVFPSFYEGFGFPILEAVVKQKPIVLLDSELNRTLHRRLGRPQSFFFFDDFRNIAEAIRAAAAFDGPWPDIESMVNDGWGRSAAEIANALRKELSSPTNFEKLEQRLATFL